MSIVWCTNSASVMFITVLNMSEQRFLVAYPVALLYSAFAMLAVFK
jgi:protein YIPF5/7